MKSIQSDDKYEVMLNELLNALEQADSKALLDYIKPYKFSVKHRRAFVECKPGDVIVPAQIQKPKPR